jgi:DNA-binding transcriptional regulator YdaS (Cro superfamily)
LGKGNVVDVYIRTLARAAEIVGGPQELAFRLKVTPSHLSLWMGGLEPCPGHVFLMAVDLVLEREIALQKTPPVPKAEVEPTGESPSVN